MPVRILFGDEVGPITDRMCLRCDHYVYENVGIDPYDCVWVFICTYCNERLLPIMAESQAQKNQRKAFLAELERTRFTRARDKATVRNEEAREREVQQLLWD
jgi:hypothetical protein